MHSIIESLEGRQLFAANLLVNGDFEAPSIGVGASGQAYTDYTAGSTGITGWKVAANSVDIVSNQFAVGYATTPASGHQVIDMAGFAPGTLTQSAATVVGQRYLLKFAYTATPFAGGGAPNIRKLNVQFGGKAVVSLSKDVTGETPTKPGWTTVQYLVTAASASSAVTFINTSAGSLGMAIDSVSLTAVPAGTASISGQVFADGNGDGLKGTDAIGLSGWKVFLDTNKNGKLDTNEIYTTTDHLGNYTFTGLAAGTYTVRVVAQTTWKQTTPATVTVTLVTGQKAISKLFGEQPI